VPDQARWFPQPPPMLPGENADAYTNRLTGASQATRVPYDHPRNRQCSLGWHHECSDLYAPGGTCQCPCHTPLGAAELRAWELEESVVALYAHATGKLAPAPLGLTWPGILAGERDTVTGIINRRPQLAEWYLSGGTP
jgi:hypothetical protein